MNKPLMKCGHVANAETSDHKPCCVICNCFDIAVSVPDISHRVACCSYCGATRPSSFDLPFFEYNPDLPYDSFYCGCGGWD